MENKILNFHFGPVCANQTRPNYSVGSDQDEAEIQYNRWSTQEWKDVNQLRMRVLSRNSGS